ncbi:MAG TPA: response regulator transcription factor [Kouleothrix sp.]|jgi:DNA-binding NarL/FixJ family response regulator|nr:response regulator transcription factor [Kouleothrix sp.]
MEAQTIIRVLLVDDHALVRDGIAGVIRGQPDMAVVGEAGDGLEALVKAQALHPDVILMDINMPGTDGLEATRLIAQALPECQIIILTMRDEDERLFDAIRSGARGYLLKTIRAQQLIDLIRGAARGEAALSPSMAARIMSEFRRRNVPAATAPASELDELTTREHDVLRLIADGLADKDIATALGVSLYTIKSHVRNILAKLHVSNRRAAARRARP